MSRPTARLSGALASCGPWLAGVCLVAYIAIFFSTRPKVAQFLGAWLFIPDEMVVGLAKEWVGGSGSRFGVADRLPIALAAAGIICVAFLAGRTAIRLLRLESKLTLLETTVLATGTGLSLLSLGTLAVGLAGGLRYRGVFLAGACLIAAGAWAALWRRPGRRLVFARLPLEGSGTGGGRSSDQIALLGLAAAFVALTIAGAILPPWHFDVREYHLQIPKEWFQSGQIDFVPHNIYGNLTLGAELHALLAMSLLDDWWTGALVGKLLIGTFSPLTALLLVSAGRRLGDPLAGSLAALLYVSLPWTVHVATAGLIDGVAAFYSFAAVYGLCLIHQPRWLPGVPATGVDGRIDPAAPQPSGRLPQTSLLALGGFFAGSAVACKYPALLFVVVPLFVCAAAPSAGEVALPFRQRVQRLLAASTVFAAGVGIGCGLWLAKNAVLAGNPVYPLLYDWLGGRDWSPAQNAQWVRAHQTPAHGWTWTALLDSLRLAGLTSEFQSPLLAPLAAIAVCRARRTRLLRLLLALIAYTVASWWLFTHRVDRFLVPVAPLVCLLGGFGLTVWPHREWRRFCGGVVLLVAVALLTVCSSRIVGDNRYLVALADLRRDHLSPHDTDFFRVNPIHDALRQLVPPGHRALLVAEAQVFDIEPPVLYNTCFNPCVFEQRLAERSSEQRRRVLRDERISHVVIAWHELRRYREPGNYGYSAFVTPALIHAEFVATGILREIDLGRASQNTQVFEVVGWRDWPSPPP